MWERLSLRRADLRLRRQALSLRADRLLGSQALGLGLSFALAALFVKARQKTGADTLDNIIGKKYARDLRTELFDDLAHILKLQNPGINAFFLKLAQSLLELKPPILCGLLKLKPDGILVNARPARIDFKKISSKYIFCGSPPFFSELQPTALVLFDIKKVERIAKFVQLLAKRPPLRVFVGMLGFGRFQHEIKSFLFKTKTAQKSQTR